MKVREGWNRNVVRRRLAGAVARVALALVLSLVVACGSSKSSTSDASSSADLSDASLGLDSGTLDLAAPDQVAPDVVAADLGLSDLVVADVLADVLEDVRIDAQPSPDSVTPTSCAEIGTTECFSNYDCADGSTRCEQVGGEQGPVCCVKGVRGTGKAGTPCQGESDCASSLCLDNVCTDRCTSADQCPTMFKSCIEIAFSGSSDKWCVP